MPDAIIPVELSAKAIEELLSQDLIDRSLKIDRTETEVFVPVKTNNLPKSLIEKYSIRIDEFPHRMRTQKKVPFKFILRSLREKGFDEASLSKLPEGWEMVGNVVIIKLPDELIDRAEEIAASYAEVLGAKSVLRDLGNIAGEERLPNMELLFGSSTEAVHVENGIKYSLDAAKIMFSSGNVDERVRMASVDCDGETIVDMFAGIGYFSLPMAVYHEPKRVYACEIRKLSYDYLVKNITLNTVSGIVVPILGDNRDFNPPEKADRVVIGYLKNTESFLPKALGFIRSGGIIHYHENCPNELLPSRPIGHLKEAAGTKWKVEVLRDEVVKSYSPGVSHIVLDAKFTEL